jgi:hypothetical protein
MWKAFITAPENAAVLNGRYAKSAEEPAPLFDTIGQDLASSNQEVREIAFWALVYAMPKLTSILYERAVREPGWRDVGGKDQQMVNRGMDIVTYLHSKLVVEHRFKIGGKYRKDPRPYMKKAITNWESDEERKREREVLLDDKDALKIPDSAPFFEESVIENNAFEMRKRELRALGFFRSDDELDLYVAAHVDKNRLDEVQKRLGIRSNIALRKRLSRTNKHMIFVRDEVFTRHSAPRTCH